MYVVTGAAGFIGANLIQGLNAKGQTNILAVDDLSDGKKFTNLADTDIADYQDMADFLQAIIDDKDLGIQAIFHQGACSTTTEWDGRYMMRNNYDYSKKILHYCVNRNIPLIYASSAAVYGGSKKFSECRENERPLNVYGYSKWLFDQYLLKRLTQLSSQVVGLRYFNVYGPYENHKASMASVAFHLMNQLHDHNTVKLFEGCDGYGDGEQRRDFIFVEDVVNVILWMHAHPKVSGIFNVGTGKSRSFNSIAKTLLKLRGSGSLEYLPFPEHLKGAYQSFTEADISALRQAGYDAEFHSLEEGIAKYYQWYQARQ